MHYSIKLAFTIYCFMLSFAALAQDSLSESLNIPYYPNGHELQSELTQVNILSPENASDAPVFMWIGGGAWAYVNRHQEMDLCRKIAREGMVVVSIGHRLSPALLGENKREEGIKHPEHVKDVAAAINWVHEHISEYGGNPAQLFIGGFSSGAHLSALVAMDERYLKAYGHETSVLSGIIPVGGGYDIPDYAKAMLEEDPSLIPNHINVVFGETKEEQLDASPTEYLDHFEVPMLMLSESYTYPFSVIFEQALSDKGYSNFEVLNCHNETHASLWKKMSFQEDCHYRDHIVRFIETQISTNGN